ncbi:MAG: lytic transglycosylase domain-containing protein [Clostridia bacterium]|nr:lytic transglycosylase domain-containing protein [Clostridia bacterium]
MRSVLKRTLVTILILALSIGIGYAYDRIRDQIDRRLYPRDYSEYVERYSAMYGVPEHIVYAVIKVESKFQSNAVSSAGAVGLMQITPDTFDWLMLRLREDLDTGMLYDPETNIRYGVYYLSYLYQEFGLWPSVFAAYNAGPNRVKAWREDPAYADPNGVLIDIPIPETKAYTKKVEEAAQVYQNLYYNAAARS